MHIYRSLDELPSDFGPSVVSIGNFDGVHLGHRKVLREVVVRARRMEAASVAVTFDPHPARVLRPENALKLITPLDVRLELLRQTGLDAVVVLPFNQEFSTLSARRFAEQVITRKLHAREVHEGDNFNFGHRAEGDVTRLAEYGRDLGFSVQVYPVVHMRGEIVSSNNLRRLIAAGDVRRARQLLGRPFTINAAHVAGRGIGQKLAVPTINLAPYPELVPGNGVYITCTRMAGEEFPSVTNVGFRPTFDGPSFAIESHLLESFPAEESEFQPVEVSFLKFLRPETKWPDAAALREQIAKDIVRARRFFQLSARSHRRRAVQ